MAALNAVSVPALPDRQEFFRLSQLAESEIVSLLLDRAALDASTTHRISERAAALVNGVRNHKKRGGLEDFLQEFNLSSREGIALMCLAEALLRIPDADTANALIRDKIGTADWAQHLGQSGSLVVNASTWALMLTGKVLTLEQDEPESLLRKMVTRSGEPVIRQAMLQAMRIMGAQFVMGRTITEALQRAEASEAKGYRYSYDMLGEAARTKHDADKYYDTYSMAIDAIAASKNGRSCWSGPSISVKLSALHPRYEMAQHARVMQELLPRVTTLARKAKALDIGFTIDAEEADRLELSLDLIGALLADNSLAHWDGLGLAVQAYQTRTMATIDWLIATARHYQRRLCVRLVKGAYWDSEIKRGQERGLDHYPVFTRKISTDVSYIACAKALLAASDVISPAFATHNAHSMATILELAGNRTDWEFQRLHGMGEPLYDQIVTPQLPCRVYAPVGSHEDLLAYLVRRLLENGANTSFVNRLQNDNLPLSELVADPIAKLRALSPKPHPRIALPADIYGQRRNSRGWDWSERAITTPLLQKITALAQTAMQAAPIINGQLQQGVAQKIFSPANSTHLVGTIIETTPTMAQAALASAHDAFASWSTTPVDERAACLERAADMLESDHTPWLMLLAYEGGRTLNDALAEIREAVDFCRYYAAQARQHFTLPHILPGPTGEHNQLSQQGRGVFACIAPWNFPLAIFMGQIVAALVAGNTVLAKPAEQTPLVGFAAVQLLHKAGVPAAALQFLPGDGASIGGAILSDTRLAGVAFTGSTQTAQIINRQLAARNGALPVLIAETGGQNALIADATALPEQVTDDVINSAFRSAGQRCSALRVLFLQDDVADKIISMITGAMQELRLDSPWQLTTDIGPVIDATAHQQLMQHLAYLDGFAKKLGSTPLPANLPAGHYFAPIAYEIDSLSRLPQEVFGPVLHVIRWRAEDLPKVLEAIRATGYGLTLGIHTRIDSRAREIAAAMPVGNIYINRSIIGATVGVQPFGGEGLSGTGPKAGGPHYLHRFTTERTLTINTTAAGGNTSLVSLAED